MISVTSLLQYVTYLLDEISAYRRIQVLERGSNAKSETMLRLATHRPSFRNAGIIRQCQRYKLLLIVCSVFQTLSRMLK